MEEEGKVRDQKELQMKKIFEAKIEPINCDVEKTWGPRKLRCAGSII
jgi:hypothetical protein